MYATRDTPISNSNTLYKGRRHTIASPGSVSDSNFSPMDLTGPGGSLRRKKNRPPIFFKEDGFRGNTNKGLERDTRSRNVYLYNKVTAESKKQTE